MGWPKLFKTMTAMKILTPPRLVMCSTVGGIQVEPNLEALMFRKPFRIHKLTLPI